MSLLARFMALLFPEKCVLCGRILKKSELDLCDKCLLEQPDCPISKDKYPYLDRWTALWYYQDNVRRSLLKYKFCGFLWAHVIDETVAGRSYRCGCDYLDSHQ